MWKKGWGVCALCLALLLITINVLAKNQDVVPKVEILSPISGTATNQNTIDVAVWFSAYKEQNDKAVGNVKTVKLLLNGQVVGTYQNPPSIKSGGVNFTVNLSALPEGTATLQAIAFQGNENAGHQGDSNVVTIIIDRTNPTITISPANDEVLTTNTPLIKVQYSDTIAGVNSTTLHVLINGVDRTALFTVTGSEATLLLTQDIALVSGENTITASITDKAGNQTQANSTFTVGIAPPATLTVPEFWPTEFTVQGRPDYELQLQALVLDAQGRGVPGIAVLFRIVEGTGTIGSTEVIKTTEQNGIATATFKPDNQEGDTKVRTSLPDYPTIEGVTYNIHKTYYIIPGIVADSSTDQEGTVNRPLSTPLQIKVVDTNHGGASLKGEEVKFSVVSGGGLIVKAQNMTNISDQDGIAGAQYLPGDGTSQVIASLWSNPEQKVTFNIIGHMPTIDSFGYLSPPSVVVNFQWLASGFLEQSSIPFPFAAVIYDWQGQAIENTPVKYEQSSGTAKITLVPGRPVSDSVGWTCSNMVMDSAGDFNVKLSFPEFDISHDFPGTQCYKLGEIVMAESSVDPPKNITRAVVPSIALIKQGNAQTCASGEKLQIPLTVETRNIFGTVPDKTKFEQDLKNYYTEEVKKKGKQNDFEIVNVILSCRVFVRFSVYRGEVSLVPDTTMSTMLASSTPQEYPLGTNVTKVEIKTLPHNIQSDINQQILKTKMLKDKMIQTMSMGIQEKDVYLPVNNPGGQASINVLCENLSSSPPVIMAEILWGDFNADIVTFDKNPTDGFDIYSLRAPSESGVWRTWDDWRTMEAYFTIAPPEVKFVSQETTQEGKVEYKEADYLLPWPVFNLNDTLNTGEQKKYRIEAKLPLSEPVTTKCGLDCLDDCREKITDIPGKIGELHADQLDMVRADDQPDTTRYLLYRSAKPFVFITQTTKLDQPKPDLPDPQNTTYIQTFGFAKPFAYAEEKVEGNDYPDVRVLSTTIRNSDRWLSGWGQQFVAATFHAPRETPVYWDAELLNGGINWSGDVIISFHRDVSPSSTLKWLEGNQPDIKFINNRLNCYICLVDGDPSQDPIGRLDGGNLIISGVQQGDEFGVAVKIGTWTSPEDKVTVVKNFSFNDLKRLENRGGHLDFVPEFRGLPPRVQNNIINTIKFALNENYSPNSTPYYSQGQQRIRINSELDKTGRFPGNGLASLPIPSARAVGQGEFNGYRPLGDMYHLHAFLATESPSGLPDKTVFSVWNTEFREVQKEIYKISSEEAAPPYLKKGIRNRILPMFPPLCTSLNTALTAFDTSPDPVFQYHTYEHVGEHYSYLSPKYVHSSVEKCFPQNGTINSTVFCSIDPIRVIITSFYDNIPRLCYLGIEYKFKVGTSHSVYLDAGDTTTIISEFQANSIALSSNLTLEIPEEHYRWTIIDRDNRIEYPIIRYQNTLVVHKADYDNKWLYGIEKDPTHPEFRRPNFVEDIEFLINRKGEIVLFHSNDGYLNFNTIIMVADALKELWP